MCIHHVHMIEMIMIWGESLLSLYNEFKPEMIIIEVSRTRA